MIQVLIALGVTIVCLIAYTFLVKRKITGWTDLIDTHGSHIEREGKLWRERCIGIENDQKETKDRHDGLILEIKNKLKEIDLLEDRIFILENPAKYKYEDEVILSGFDYKIRPAAIPKLTHFKARILSFEGCRYKSITSQTPGLDHMFGLTFRENLYKVEHNGTVSIVRESKLIPYTEEKWNELTKNKEDKNVETK